MVAKIWDAADKKKLADLWMDPALSVDNICEIMKKSKGAIVGQRRRMKLPLRVEVDPNCRVVKKSTFQTVERVAERRKTPMARHDLKVQAEVIKDIVRSLPPPLPHLFRSPDQCCFLSGKNKPWVQCAKPAKPNRPYCVEHCQVAYEKERAW